MGVNKAEQKSRPLVGRTTHSRITCDVLDPKVRPTRGRYCVLYILSPGRSGYALRHGGYNKSDLQGGPYPLNLDGSELYLNVGGDGEVELFY